MAETLEAVSSLRVRAVSGWSFASCRSLCPFGKIIYKFIVSPSSWNRYSQSINNFLVVLDLEGKVPCMLSKCSPTELHPSPRRDFLCQLSVLTSSASFSILLDMQGMNQLLPAPPSCSHCPLNKDIYSVLSYIV